MANRRPTPKPENLGPPWPPGTSGNPAGYSRKGASRGQALFRFSRRNFEWTIAWPLAENHSTVLRGCSEAIYRDHRGRWRPVIVSTAAGDSQSERLRLMLSCVAALQRGFDPGGPGWWVRLGTDEKMLVDVHVNFNPAAIGQTLAEWLRASDLAAACSMP
jgi:hypothetical protein